MIIGGLFMTILSLDLPLHEDRGENKATMDIGSFSGPQVLEMPNSSLTDEQLIQKTRDLPEVQVLISKYPYASDNIHILRPHESSPTQMIRVIYTIERTVADANGDPIWRRLELIALLPPDSNDAGSVKIECSRRTGWGQGSTSDPMIMLQNNMCFS